MSDDRGVAYGLVMPFLPVTSRGGPHDDAAYTAGYEAGRIDGIFDVVPRSAPVNCRVLARVENVEQLDLIAMRHGGAATVVAELDHGWVEVRVVRPALRAP